jgi:hypothetical protein
MRFLMICAGLVFSGCSTGPIPLGGSEYMITTEYEVSIGTAQRKAIEGAAKHCASRGQVVELGVATPIAGNNPGFSLRYRCKAA